MTLIGRPWHCGVCGVGATWRITRRSDAHVAWACPQHLSAVCDEQQLDAEVTALVLVLVAKWVEWLELGARLEDIADEPPPNPPLP